MRQSFMLLAVCSRPSVASSVAAASTKDIRLSLVAYSTPREAYAELIPAVPWDTSGEACSSRSPTGPRASRRGP